jgi:hypothetical protein
MGDVVTLPTPDRPFWVCRCGCYSHIVYADGGIECAACSQVQPPGSFALKPCDETPEQVKPTAINRRFTDASFARRSIAREIDSPDLAGVCLIFNSGRVRSVVTEVADTDERRAWWRRRVVDFLRHAFGEVVKP